MNTQVQGIAELDPTAAMKLNKYKPMKCSKCHEEVQSLNLIGECRLCVIETQLTDLRGTVITIVKEALGCGQAPPL